MSSALECHVIRWKFGKNSSKYALDFAFRGFLQNGFAGSNLGRERHFKLCLGVGWKLSNNLHFVKMEDEVFRDNYGKITSHSR